MKPQRVLMVKDKETKNTIRYREVEIEQPAVIRHLYVRKWAVGDMDKVVVTIEGYDETDTTD